MKVVRYATSKNRPPLPTGNVLATHSVRGKINSKMYKIYTKVNLRIFLNSVLRYFGIIANKSQIKLNLSWDKSIFLHYQLT